MEAITIITKIIEKLKLKDVVTYETKKITPFFDYAMIATASSQRQLLATINHLKQEASSFGLYPRGIEGQHNAVWALIDFGTIVVHVFTSEERERFDLDKLWKDLPSQRLLD